MPFQTASEKPELAATIQVYAAPSPSPIVPPVVPVLPMISEVMPGFEALPEPADITVFIATAMACATFSSIAWVQLLDGGSISVPSRSEMLLIAMGLQDSPLFAIAANAVASDSGATLLRPEPMMSEEFVSSGVPLALCTPSASAMSAVVHWSSFSAIARKPVLIESCVDCSALILPKFAPASLPGP